MVRRVRNVCVCFCFFLALVWLLPAYAAGVQAENPQMRRENSIEQPFADFTGSGFFISPDIVVTCNHVVNGASRIEVVYKEAIRLTATVIGVDPAGDLALLRVPGAENAVKPLVLADAGSVRTGGRVYVVGFPLPEIMGVSAKLSEGIISCESGIGGDLRMFQISNPVQPGNSGGPLLNGRAEVVGVVSGGLNPVLLFQEGIIAQNVNYAVKINNLRNLIARSNLNNRIPEKRTAKYLEAESVMDIARQAVVLVMVSK